MTRRWAMALGALVVPLGLALVLARTQALPHVSGMRLPVYVNGTLLTSRDLIGRHPRARCCASDEEEVHAPAPALVDELIGGELLFQEAMRRGLLLQDTRGRRLLMQELAASELGSGSSRERTPQAMAKDVASPEWARTARRLIVDRDREVLDRLITKLRSRIRPRWVPDPRCPGSWMVHFDPEDH